jgi:Protein of unknown function (DUF4038)/Putative collagen-binding domain of a collagenase
VAVGWADSRCARVGVVAGAIALLVSCGLKDPLPPPVASDAGGPQTIPTVPPPIGGFPVPTSISADHQYFLDQNGDPYMVLGDSPQCLSANLSTPDMEYFFADRQAHGFNAAWVNLVCGPYTFGREDGSTYDEIPPFTTEGDLSTPNPDYWHRMDEMVRLAAERGITLILDPAETGSWAELLKNNGEVKSRDYGEFLGERYKGAANIMWMLGNDYQPEQWETYDPFLTALAQGIHSADAEKLLTAELNYYASTSYDNPTWPPLIDFATAYTYQPTYDIVLKAYHGTPTQPVVMIEANYEEENNDGGPRTTDVTMRRQEYWTLTSGATGQLYGNKHTWGLQNSDWKRHFDTPAVDQLALMAKLVKGKPWHELVPDESNSFLVDGAGTYTAEGDVLDSDYATAAITPDGTFGLVYVPTSRTIEVDMSKMAEGAVARWFDPTDGSFRDAPSGETPGKNAAGDEDWILVVEAPTD